MTRFAKRIGGGSNPAYGRIFAMFDQPGVISLGDGVPDASTFPAKELEKMTMEVFEDFKKDASMTNKLFSYWEAAGLPELVSALTDRYMGKFNSGDPEKDTLLTFTGAQQVIDLAARVFLDPGDTIIVEENSYGGAITAFRSYEANVIGVETDEEGIVPEALEAVLKADPKVKLIYTIATFSNPMGIETTLERRQAMYDLAVKYDVIILEDSPYFELRYSGNYIPSIKSLDKTGHVIFAGSLSKIITPGVRIGYAIGSKEIMQAFGAEKDNQTINSPGIIQLAVAKYMTEYDLDAHIADACSLYRKKRDAMLAALEKELGGIASWTHPEGGFFLWLTLPEGVSGDEFAAYLAENKKVILYPGSMYRPDGKDINAVRLNFSVPTEDQIDECISRIAGGLRDFMK